MTLDALIDALDDFRPAQPPEDYHNYTGDRTVRDLFKSIAALPDAGRALSAMLGVIERHVDAHFHYGYLVASLEKCPGYEQAALDALTRAPTPLVVLAASRLRRRPNFAAEPILDQIRAVLDRPGLDENTREYAQAILDARPVEQIIADFDNFQPTPDINHTGRELLHTLCNELQVTSDPGQGIEAVLDVMQRFPNEDLGTPGPLVHALEEIGGYEDALFARVERDPVPHTVEMVGRIFNGPADPALQARAETLLHAVLANLDAHQGAREFAALFLHVDL